MPERLKAILDKITAWWKKFNTKQRSVLISIAAVVIVALVILGVVISRPTQVELVEAQSASEASTIKGVLEDNNTSLILKKMSSLRHMQALESVEPYLIRSGKWTGFQEQSDKGKGK